MSTKVKVRKRNEEQLTWQTVLDLKKNKKIFITRGTYMKTFNLEFFDGILPVFGLSTSQININCVLGSD